MASTRISEDPRIDPRIKAMLAELNPAVAADDATSREQVLEEASTEGAVAQRTMVAASLGMSDTEEIAPSNGLTVTDHGVVSDPDGNKIRIRLIRPDGHDVVVDFRNALAPSSVDEVAPYPAGLNDCVSASGGWSPRRRAGWSTPRGSSSPERAEGHPDACHRAASEARR